MTSHIVVENAAPTTAIAAGAVQVAKLNLIHVRLMIQSWVLDPRCYDAPSIFFACTDGSVWCVTIAPDAPEHAEAA